LLSGFMASGKSTVGKLLAELAGRPFIDLDRRLESRFGAPISRIFAERGEPAFRAAEREELRALLSEQDGPAPVIALGGGCLTLRELRLFALDRAVVITLELGVDDVVARAGTADSRPNLTGDVRQRAAELLELRASAYAEAHARLDTRSAQPAELAARALRAWQRNAVAVASGENSYVVEVARGHAAERLPDVCEHCTKLLLLSDQNVAPLHAGRLESALTAAGKSSQRFEFEPSELQKNLSSIERALSAALSAGLDRRSRIIGLGGGVVTDMAGFVAASYMRGIAWVALPTTLLAMVDASVGGKTGVDLGPAKNAVGAFWQPSSVLCDIEHLLTEPERGYRSALSEVVKTAIIGDPELFLLLEREVSAILARDWELLLDVVRRCVRVKARVVSADPREAGLRAVLNLGHTVGHALEAQAGYERLRHGEAVSLGLVAALRIGAHLAHTPRELAERTERLLQRLQLPTELGREPLVEAAELIGHDKKRAGGQISFVVARGLGDVMTTPLDLEQLRGLTRQLSASARA
jgi:shikimate kinase/3-dehydroquinate synthase